MIKKIGLTLLTMAIALVVVLVVAIATRPATYKIQRSVQIYAPAAVVYANLDDLNAWRKWFPWAPDTKSSYSDPAVGPGSSYTWGDDDDNDKMPAGKVTITKSVFNESVVIDVKVWTPTKPKNPRLHVRVAFASFSLQPSGDGVRVDLTLSSEKGFVGKALGMVSLMAPKSDRVLAIQLDTWLASLKSVSEADAAKAVAAAPVPPDAPTAH